MKDRRSHHKPSLRRGSALQDGGDDPGGAVRCELCGCSVPSRAWEQHVAGGLRWRVHVWCVMARRCCCCGTLACLLGGGEIEKTARVCLGLHYSFTLPGSALPCHAGQVPEPGPSATEPRTGMLC